MQKGICLATLLLASVGASRRRAAGAREPFKGLRRLSCGGDCHVAAPHSRAVAGEHHFDGRSRR